MITDAQGLAIRNTSLIGAGSPMVGDIINPHLIYPARDAKSSGRRRALYSLVKKGLVVRCYEDGAESEYGACLKVVSCIEEAYVEWYKKRGYNLV